MQFHSPYERLEINVWPWLLAAGLPVLVLVLIMGQFIHRSEERSRLPSLPARPPALLENAK